jgi:hypothetical protein
MKSIVYFICYILISSSMNAQSNHPVDVVQRQLDAYNKQDVKTFAAQFSDSVKVYNTLGDIKPSLEGRAAVEQRYAELFKKYPKNYSTLTGRIVNNGFVIDHESISGREDAMQIVAIYEVKDGLIINCWFAR